MQFEQELSEKELRNRLRRFSVNEGQRKELTGVFKSILYSFTYAIAVDESRSGECSSRYLAIIEAVYYSKARSNGQVARDLTIFRQDLRIYKNAGLAARGSCARLTISSIDTSRIFGVLSSIPCFNPSRRYNLNGMLLPISERVIH